MHARRILCMPLLIAILLCGVVTLAYGAPPFWESIQNNYIGLSVGQSGDTRTNPALPVPGRFLIWNTGGDPTTPNDDGLIWNYTPDFPVPCAKFGSWEIVINDVSTSTSTTTSTTVDTVRSVIWGDTTGVWKNIPYVGIEADNIIRGVWYPGAPGATSTGSTTTAVTTTPIRCELEARMMRDTVRFKWTLTNEGITPIRVGMKLCADVQPNPEIFGGTSGLRNVISIPGYPLLEHAVALMGNDIPTAIEMMDSQDDPSMSMRMIMNAQGATKPDVVGVDDRLSTESDLWNFTRGLPGRPYFDWLYKPTDYLFINDVGYAAAWMPQNLVPGQSRTIIEYLGLGSSTSDFTKPNLDHPQYVASVQGPRTLGYYRPASVADTGPGQLSPNPFTITAYMTNTEKHVDFNSASFTLMLPPGLELDSSEAGKFTKSLVGISAGTEGSVSWLVKPVQGKATGVQKYSVSISANPVGGTTVNREINIPALEEQPLTSGWQMVSVPFEFSDPSPASAFGNLTIPGPPGLPGTPGGFDYALKEYDPTNPSSVWVDATVLRPGTAYWLHLPQLPAGQALPTTSFASNSNPIAWAGTQGRPIKLDQGWNMIGNPYVYSIAIGETRFYSRELGILSYDQALSMQLISPTIFWWNTTFGRYDWSSLRSTRLNPWQGYWIRVLRPDITMYITPISVIGAKLGGEPTGGTGGGPAVP